MIGPRSRLAPPLLVALGLAVAACSRQPEVLPSAAVARTAGVGDQEAPQSTRRVPVSHADWEALAHRDPDAALATLHSLPAREEATQVIVVYRVLASTAPRLIADSIGTLVADSRERQQIVDELLRTVLETDFEAGRRLLPYVTDADSRASALRDIGCVFAADNLPDAVAWLREFPGGPERMAVASGILSPWAARDLPSAAAWFETLTPNEQHRLLPMIIGRLAEAEPARAAKILGGMNADEFESYLPAALANWAKRDVAPAATWVAALEPRRREQAVAILRRELTSAAP